MMDAGSPCRPTVAQNPEVTHAGLVTTVTEFEDIDLTAKMAPFGSCGRRQLILGRWPGSFGTTPMTNHFYSIVLKPNGWELGKEDPNILVLSAT